MKLMNRETTQILVERDPAGSAVALRFESTVGDDATVIHLSPDEARRLAALILFQASKLERPAPERVFTFPGQELKSA